MRWKNRLDAKAGKYHVWYGFAVGIFAQDCEAHWLWHLSGNRTYDSNWSWRKGVTLYAVVGAFLRETFWVGQIKLAWWFERSISLHSGSFLENDMWHHQPATDRFSSRLEMFLSFFSFFFRPFFLVGSFGIYIVSPRYSLRNLEICNLPSLKLTALRTCQWMVGILYSFLFGAFFTAYILSWKTFSFPFWGDVFYGPFSRWQTSWGQEWTPQTPKSCRFVGTLGVSRNLCSEGGNFWFPPSKVWWIVSRWWFQICFKMFTPNLGEMIQFDEHIFQMGWFNHQPVLYSHFDSAGFSFFFLGVHFWHCVWTFRRHKKKTLETKQFID